jgi:hypothetical protein
VLEGTEEVRRESEERVEKLIAKVGREAEQVARARAEERLRTESDRLRREADRREEMARQAAEEEIRSAADRARRDALAAAARTAPEWEQRAAAAGGSLQADTPQRRTATYRTF